MNSFNRTQPTSLGGYICSPFINDLFKSQQEFQMNSPANIQRFADQLKWTGGTEPPFFSALGMKDLKNQTQVLDLVQTRLAHLDVPSLVHLISSDLRFFSQYAHDVLGVIESVRRCIHEIVTRPAAAFTPRKTPVEHLVTEIALAVLVKCNLITIAYARNFYVRILGVSPVKESVFADKHSVSLQPNPARVYNPAIYTPEVIDQILGFSPPDVKTRDDMTALMIDLVAVGLLDEHVAFKRISALRSTLNAKLGVPLSEHAGDEVHQVFTSAHVGFASPNFAVDLPDGLKADQPGTPWEKVLGADSAPTDESPCDCIDCHIGRHNVAQLSNGTPLCPSDEGREALLDHLRKTPMPTSYPRSIQESLGAPVTEMSNSPKSFAELFARRGRKNPTRMYVASGVPGRVEVCTLEVSPETKATLEKIITAVPLEEVKQRLHNALVQAEISEETHAAIRTILRDYPDATVNFPEEEVLSAILQGKKVLGVGIGLEDCNLPDALTQAIHDGKLTVRRAVISAKVQAELRELLANAKGGWKAGWTEEQVYREAVLNNLATEETLTALRYALDISEWDFVEGMRMDPSSENPLGTEPEQPTMPNEVDWVDSLFQDRGKFFSMPGQTPLVRVSISQAVRDELNKVLSRRSDAATSMLLNALKEGILSEEAQIAVLKILNIPEFSDQIEAILANVQTETPKPHEENRNTRPVNIGPFTGPSLPQLLERYDTELADFQRVAMEGMVAAEDIRAYVEAIRNTQQFARYILQCFDGIDSIGSPVTDYEVDILKAHLRYAVNARTMTLQGALSKLRNAESRLNKHRVAVADNKARAAQTAKQAEVERAEQYVKAKTAMVQLHAFARDLQATSIDDSTTVKELDDFIASRIEQLVQLRIALISVPEVK